MVGESNGTFVLLFGFCQWLVTLIQMEETYCEIPYLYVPGSCQLMVSSSGFPFLGKKRTIANLRPVANPYYPTLL